MPRISSTTITGTKGTEVSLPDYLFAAPVNPRLMAQAVRVYLSNQRQAGAKTKHRGEVNLSKAKWYKQKGTGRARHGAQSAPLFVGGGIAHGPQGFQNFQLEMPQKMRQRSLASALTWKLAEQQVRVVEGLEKLETKAKAAQKVVTDLSLNKQKVSVILAKKDEKLVRTWRNLAEVSVLYANLLNTYEILNGGTLLISPGAVEVMEKTYRTLQPKVEVEKMAAVAEVKTTKTVKAEEASAEKTKKETKSVEPKKVAKASKTEKPKKTAKATAKKTTSSK